MTAPRKKRQRYASAQPDLDVWHRRKRKSLAIAKAYEGLGYQAAGARMKDCAPKLFWAATATPDGQGVNERVVLFQTCKSRFCDVCSVLRARKIYARVAPRFEAVLRDTPGARAALATFTMPNVPLDQCQRACRKLLSAFRRMTQQKAFKDAVIGWMRTIELTFNRKTGELHPHLHAVLIFRRGYFDKRNTLFISQPRWVTMWQKAIKDDACRIVDVRVLRPKDKSRPLSSALAEVCKYPMKPMDLVSETAGHFKVDPHVLGSLHDGLRGMRLYGFGGRLRALEKAINDLDNTEDDWKITREELEALADEFEPDVVAAESFHWAGSAYLAELQPSASAPTNPGTTAPRRD